MSDNNFISKVNSSAISNILHLGTTEFSNPFSSNDLDLGICLVYGPEDTELFFRTLSDMEVGDELYLKEGAIPHKLNMNGRSIVVCNKTGGSIGMLDSLVDKIFASFIHNGFTLKAKVNMINTDISMKDYKSWKPLNIHVWLSDSKSNQSFGEVKHGMVALRTTSTKKIFLIQDIIDVAFFDKTKLEILFYQKEGEELKLIHKQDEHRDGKYAVQILNEDKKVVGYVRNSISQIISVMLDSGKSIYAVLKTKAKFGKTNKGTFIISEMPVIDIYMDDYSYAMSTDFDEEERVQKRKEFDSWLDGEMSKPVEEKKEIYLGKAKVYGLRDEVRLKRFLCGLQIEDEIKLTHIVKNVPVTNDNTGESIIEEMHSIRVDTLSGDCLGYMQPREDLLISKMMTVGMTICAKVDTLNLAEPFNRKEALRLSIYLVENEKDDALEQNISNELAKIDNDDSYPGTCFDLGFANDLKKMEDASEKLSSIKTGDALKFVRDTESEEDPKAIKILTMSGVELGYLYHYNCEFIPNLMDAGKMIYGVVRNIHDEGKPIFASLDFWIYVIF